MSNSKNTALITTAAILGSAFALPAAAKLASETDLSEVSETFDEKVTEITNALGDVLRPQYDDRQP